VGQGGAVGGFKATFPALGLMAPRGNGHAVEAMA
jgi:hypothetical protein